MGKIVSFKTFAEVPKVLKALERLAIEIKGARTLSELDAVIVEAKEVQRKYSAVSDVANKAGEIWVKAELRLARELTIIGKAKGTQGQIRGAKPGKRGQRGLITGMALVEVPEKNIPTRAEMGIGYKRSARATKLNEIPEPVQDRYCRELVDEGKAVNPNAVLQKHRQHNKAKMKRKIMAAAFSAEGPFDVVVSDPPWYMQKIDRDVRPNQDAFDYPVMKLDEIKAHWEREIAPRLKLDAHIFWWTTEKYLPSCLAILDQLSLRYVLTMIWHKPGGFQPHDLPQYNAEFIVYARKGTPVFVDTKNFFVCNEWPRREHSRKPKEFYELIARVTAGSRLDVFSREQHPGFAQFGNETAKFKRAAE
jgi:N6-adenosine-specific RNA methylase IME4